MTLVGNPVSAQKPPTAFLAAKSDSHAHETKVDFSIDGNIPALQAKLETARAELNSALNFSGSAASTQRGASDTEMAEYVYLLREVVASYEKHIDYLEKLKEKQQARRDLQSDSMTWQGFPQQPPYSMNLVDDLRNEILSHDEAIRGIGVERAMVAFSIEEHRSSMETAEKVLRQRSEQLEGTTEKEEALRARWLRDLAQLRIRQHQAALAADETERRLIDATIAYHRDAKAFLERKLEIAVSGARLSARELNEKLEFIATELGELEKEIERASLARENTQRIFREARGALQASRNKALSAQWTAEERSRRIAHLETVLQTRQGQAETATQFVKSLKLLREVLLAEHSIWESRYSLLQSQDVDKFNEAIRNISNYLKQTTIWKNYFINQLDITGSLINTQQERLSTWDDKNGDKRFVDELLKSYFERADLYRRAILKVKDMDQLLRRWQDEINRRRQTVSVQERVTDVFSSTKKAVEKIWNYELFTAEDTLTVDGQEITGKRGVTVRKVLLVMLILGLGLWVSRYVANHTGRILLRRVSMADNIATLLQRGVYLVLIFTLVLVALSIVNIPLTVFAFLGGALVIGVGFGAQNLINNFISGIILLLERPIKIGDIIEVDGVQGNVVAIGGRCSQVRRFDGVDILIPNSSVLERNVINWTLADRNLRICVRVGVAYGSPTRKAMRLVKKAVSEHGKVLSTPKPTVLFEDFGDNALIIAAYFWAELMPGGDTRVIASDIRHRIEVLFAKSEISIAFPQRDVHVDSLGPVRVELVNTETDRATPLAAPESS